ncbi:MAG: SpoIIE family protein phosphatase [Vicinamibacteria bacterium]
MVLRLRIEPREGEPFVRSLEGDSLVLGRSSKADVVVNDRFLSRLHARLSRREGGWFLEDLGSRNTTYLNDRPLGEATVVRAGDVIRLAESRIVVEDEEAVARGDDGLEAGELSGRTVLRHASVFLSSEDGVAPTADARAAGRLRLLNEVHKRLASPITLEALLELILESAFTHLAPDQGAVFLRRPDGTFDRAASRRSPGTKDDFGYSRRLAQEVTEKGVAALVVDTGLDERFAASESLVISGVRTLIAAPLLDDEGCLGMIALGCAHRPRPFEEGDLELLVALASAAALRIRNIALTEEAARRRLLDRELELAHDIQMAMLPRAFPDRPEIEVAANLRPARSVGGDLYDVLGDGGRVWLMIGDVSGKGVGAALFMAVTKTLFRAVAQGAATVASAVERMNAELARDNDRAMFVTAFVARLDLATGELEYVNAGHNPPYRLDREGRLVVFGEPSAPALGAVEGQEYRGATARLGRGDTLVLYTDGVVEARSPAGEEFHVLRLEKHLAASAGAPPAALVRGLVDRVEEFAADVPQYDDVTVLVARWLGGPETS